MINVHNPDGLGIIDIVSDGFLHCLKIDRIIAADSDDNGGTIAHYYELAGFNRDDIGEIAGRMNSWLIAGTAKGIEEKIREFLLLFEPGEYEIEIDKTCADYDFGSDDYYPGSELFINLTQPIGQLNEKRIAFYMESLNKGVRPRLVLFTKKRRYYQDDNPEKELLYERDEIHFLLDGHHKLMAYHRLKLPVHYVLIRGIFPDTVKPETSVELFLEARPVLSPHFRDFLLLDNMQVLTDTAETTLQYNRLLDNAIAAAERPGMRLINEFKKRGENGTAAEKKWAVARLDALAGAFHKGCKPKTFYYMLPGGKQWESLLCNDYNMFDRWCVHYFGMSYTDYRTRILFGR